LDLLDAITSGQRSEHGLVESSEEELDLSVRHQPTELVEVGRIMCLQPFEERPRQVEHRGEELVGGKMLEDRSVYVSNVLLEDVVEVADWLVEMQAKDESDRSHRLPDHQ
jgi:hypothetical protein